MEPNEKVLHRYLNKVCAEVRAKGMHDEIREELSGHFADLMTERQNAANLNAFPVPELRTACVR